MLFVSYSYNALHNHDQHKGFENMMIEDHTIEPKDKESLYEVTHIVEKDLRGRIGYDAVNATILWWKLL